VVKLVLDTGPTERVVSAADLRSHSRIDDTSEDNLLNELSDSAQEEAEAYTWRKFLEQTWEQYFDGFADPLFLRYPPLHSSGISSITYTDTNGDTQTLATSVYEAGEVDGIAVVRRKYNQTWPSTRGHEDVVKVTFICGWDTPADVPDRIKQAVRLHAAWYYRNREGEPHPQAFYDLLEPFRAMKFQKTGAA
jgi:uncharacterized phiE125 gp8 family phage protein